MRTDEAQPTVKGTDAFNADGFKLFVQEWRKIDTEFSELSALFRDLSSLSQSALKASQITDIDEVKLDTLQNFIEEIRTPLANALESGEFFNVWSVAGLARDELTNSTILAWLFNRYGTHGQRHGLLRQLLVRLRDRLPAPFHSENWMRSHYVVRREVYPLGSVENRVDIEVDSPECLIFFEVKIDASEGPAQLSRYRELAHEKAKERPYVVIYLCVSEPDYIETGTVTATWNDVAVAIKDYLRISSSIRLAPVLRICLGQLANHWQQLR